MNTNKQVKIGDIKINNNYFDITIKTKGNFNIKHKNNNTIYSFTDDYDIVINGVSINNNKNNIVLPCIDYQFRYREINNKNIINISINNNYYNDFDF